MVAQRLTSPAYPAFPIVLSLLVAFRIAIYFLSVGQSVLLIVPIEAVVKWANVIALTDGEDMIVPWLLHVFPMDAVIMEAALIKAFAIVIVIIRERIAPFI